MRISHVALFVLAYLVAAVCALRLDLHGVRKPHSSSRLRPRTRGSELNNTADISYYADIKIGGKVYTLLVDTGSSDLWISGRVPNSSRTQFSSAVSYAVGSVEGPVKTAEVEFAGYKIPDQAYLEVTPNVEHTEGDGIIGLGPNDGSNIYQEMQAVAGAALVDRIFLQNRTTPNYLTFLLGRSDDPTDFYSGAFSIGEVIDGFENVLKQPKLPVSNVPNHQLHDQHFQLLLDEDGLIGPDGTAIPVYTEVIPTTDLKRATVVIDTGFSLPQVPSAVASAIYSRFAGAQLVNVASVGKIWVLSCHQEVNITFKFNGRPYPIHPLDATLDPKTIGLSGVTDVTGRPMCIGTFQPFSYNRGSNPNYDMVLGMAFLRNVYALIDYGDFIVGSDGRDAPYVQFLSTTDLAEAHTDFVKIRLDGVDTTANQTLVKHHAIQPWMYYVIMTIVGVVIFAGISFFFICRAKRNDKLAEASDTSPQQSPAPQMRVSIVPRGPPSYHGHTALVPDVLQPPQLYGAHGGAPPPGHVHMPRYYTTHD
ncbi:putative peptidase A1 family protein [Lyophyllum shimeji]|uniref:Peptidase A1 family protein n=1 Tax=Lyophyllum shimeji TaxID=47721 RepID=A0A9P3PLN7_LYOSH|nr:putative peptidase A1 family protein [Lyophyllum shimeji]